MPIVARENAPLLPFDYSPDGETVKFRLRGLSTAELLDVQAMADFDVENNTMRWTRRAKQAALQAGLLGWDGFMDAAGKPVDMAKKAADNIELLGVVLTNQLFGEIMTASNLTGEQAKN